MSRNFDFKECGKRGCVVGLLSSLRQGALSHFLSQGIKAFKNVENEKKKYLKTLFINNINDHKRLLD